MAYIEIKTDDRTVICKFLQEYMELEHADVTLDHIDRFYIAAISTEREEEATTA